MAEELAKHWLGARKALPRRHIAAATIGNALEFYDFLTYAFFAIQIGHALFPVESAYGSLMMSLAIFGAGFVTRPIGGLVIGAYSDRAGRRAAMILSFTMIGASIIAMALIPPYSAIGIAAPFLAVIARMVQGFSLGGEVGSNTAFLLEAAPIEQRGLTVSWQGASQYGALMVGGAVGVVLSAVLPHALLDAYGWRIAFLLGAATLPFGLWLRHQLPETLHDAEPGVATPRSDVSRWELARGHWRVILIGLVVLACATVGSYVLVYIGTYAQHTLHMSAASGFAAETVGNLTSVLAVLIGGWQSDRIGRWPVNVGWNLFFLATIYPTFYWLSATRSEFALIMAVIVLSAGVAAASGSFYAALCESLPKTIRGAGFGTIYSFSIAAFGGTTQLVITWLIHVTGDPLAPAWYLTCATAIAQIALMLLPESAPARISPRVAASSA